MFSFITPDTKQYRANLHSHSTLSLALQTFQLTVATEELWISTTFFMRPVI